MFADYMMNAWDAATLVAVVAGFVGFFTVLKGSAFAAHALPNGAFAGAAGASLIGVNVMLGLGAFSLLGAVSIGLLGRRARHDVATALTIVLMLGLGALFLSRTTEYAPQIYALLFGQLLGVQGAQLLATAVLALIGGLTALALYRPLLFAAVAPENAAVRGLAPLRVDLAFLLLVAVATTTAVPVVGSLLIFSLLIGPPSAARSLTSRPGRALLLSIVIALVCVWTAIALAYISNLPVGFFVGSSSALVYAGGRAWVGRDAVRSLVARLGSR